MVLICKEPHISHTFPEQNLNSEKPTFLVVACLMTLGYINESDYRNE